MKKKIDTGISTGASAECFNYGETENKVQTISCKSCGETIEIKWVEQRWPYISSGSGQKTINTFTEELNKAGFIYLVGDKTYFFHQKCFRKIIKQKED